jgi:chalcone isomerase-like protein
MIRRMKKALAACLLLVLSATLLLALDVAGVKLPDTVTVEGKTLNLNGAGVRKKMMFKVYVAGLYVERPSKDGSAILASAEAKSMRLHILRNLKGKQISDAIEDGFQKNSQEQIARLRDRLDKLAAMFPDVAEGDEIALSWIPDKGTVVSVRGTERGTIEGRDFADALFAVWIGPNPVQDDLKKALLGG